MITTAAISLLSIVVPGLFAWVVTVQSEVAVLKADYKSLEKLIESKFDSLEQNLDFKHRASEQRLERIERRLFNGNSRDH